ncbi:MAG TPA: hypothetical protein VG452_13660, partial [Egibacteraceae bacterium]|nr:hypothetical protein [Egibacteraceae bacterium]
MAHDDGFGPPLRGGGRSAGSAPVRERGRPDQAGFGPPLRGRRSLLPRLGRRLVGSPPARRPTKVTWPV